MQIHQLLPGFHAGDAISDHALALRNLLRTAGHSSHLYARDIAPEVAHQCRDFREYAPPADAITIYHYSLGFDELSRLFIQAPGKRIFVYHNITPHAYLAGYNDAVAQACWSGRERLNEFRDAADMVLGDSEFNCRELKQQGFRDPRVLPILVDFASFGSTSPCQRILRRFGDDWTNFLFVGRLSPNKRQDDVIRLFARYNQWIDRRSRLFLVGSGRGMERYHDELQALIADYELQDQIELTGHVSPAELKAYYRLADVFVCMSEHEGFCVPLLEAFYHQVPVLAFRAGAVPETMGEAGVLVARKDFPILAEMAELLVSDPDFRVAVVQEQTRRLADFQPGAIARLFQEYLRELQEST